MAWTEDIYPHFEPYDPHIFPAPQQPTTILQQLPATMMPPGSAPSIRPGGHVKEDLVELMMIQNAQMQQVMMNNMAMSALSSFGYSSPPCGPAGTRIRAPRDLVIIQENEADPEVYHHHYQPVPYLSYPVWLLPQATLLYQDPNTPTSSPSHRDSSSCSPPDSNYSTYLQPAAPPHPTPRSTVTAGADITHAAENNRC